MADTAIEALSEAQAQAELVHLNHAIGEADEQYHRLDAPVIDDATYDALRRRYQAIIARFPALARLDDAAAKVGAPSRADVVAR
jgi:DNA ligase (NAD+)